MKKGISGSTLKMIAIITMFIDHVGAAILMRFMFKLDAAQAVAAQAPALAWMADPLQLHKVYSLTRDIGRIAFPIFCFLLTEGFMHTRNHPNYAKRLAVFVLLSEIPFDLAFSAELLEFGYQNVFFTLLLGLLCMMACQWAEETFGITSGKCKVLQILALLFFAGAAELLRTDYGAKGILCIMVLYLFRRNRTQQILAGAISFTWENPAPAAFLPIACYNGKRGWDMKYFFYLFYPLHLLLIYLICRFLGIDGMSVV